MSYINNENTFACVRNGKIATPNISTSNQKQYIKSVRSSPLALSMKQTSFEHEMNEAKKEDADDIPTIYYDDFDRVDDVEHRIAHLDNITKLNIEYNGKYDDDIDTISIKDNDVEMNQSEEVNVMSIVLNDDDDK